MKEALLQSPVFTLSNIPSQKERLAHIKPELISIASHELNHILVGYHFGFIGDISLKPEGNSLARSTFQGSISPGIFQIMAAAGAVNTPDALAQGYGSDLNQVDLVKYFYQGASREEAITSAQSILSQYPKEIRIRAAEIIAYIGEVSSCMIPLILKRAKEELAIYENFMIPEADSFVVKTPSCEKTIIENKGNIQKIIYIKGNEIIKEMEICQICGGINAHLPNCSANSTAIFIETSQIPDEEYGLPKRGNIFSQN